MNHIVATVRTLLGILENIKTTMGTRNNLFNLIIRIGVLPPGLLIRIVMPVILGQNHNKYLSGLRQETSAVPGVQAS
jgi:fumarate hydratase class II